MQKKEVSTPWLSPVFNELLKTYQQGRLAHGLLFTGSVGLGKYKLASQLSVYLLCSDKQANGACGHCHSCRLFSAGNHLDFYILKSENNKAIGIDEVRALINMLNERPHLGDNKVVLIKDSALLSKAAANALLKTLEEPQGNSYLILLADTHHQLMPTLLSRVLHQHIHTPNDAQLLSWLDEQNVQVTDLGVLRQFQSCPLVLLNYLQELQAGLAVDERRDCVEGLFKMLVDASSLFDFSAFLSKVPHARLQLLFFLLHEIQKIKLNPQGLYEDAIYAFARPQLDIWCAQISLSSLRDLSAKLLKTRNLIRDQKALKKELLINALLIEIKNEFKEKHLC
ncbi:DNA polymerase III subunit delta' [Psychromonas sp. CNPT3]|uniref:DNA polymerase III subunit n=1 Tax=Psychromonas sp. CNPT3 TaxID=314282 RepID=UPI00006E809D|nr:DNA polymerase III subunit [Psychromonas sp. CNPT3]AGH80764.1 DNA polymerase III subunit delta' [Psychromonas sp. CNPT3]